MYKIAIGVTAIPNIQYRLSDQWSGFSELVYRKAESQDNEYGLTSGVIYALNERTQLDASVGVDLDGADKSLPCRFRYGVLVLSHLNHLKL